MPLPFFNPAVLPQLFTLATLAVCPARPAPQVEVHFSMAEIFYNEGHSSAELKHSMRDDRESTLVTDRRSTLLGVTTSLTTDNFRVMFKTLTDQQGNQCLYVDKAIFWIAYQPAVFISSDIHDMPCSYNVTRAHEAEHVAIDMNAIEEYLPQVKLDMLLYLQSLGYQGFGPYSRNDLPKHQAKLLKTIAEASKPMVEKLREARRKRQGAIDTIENYKRESDKCPEDREMMRERFYSK